MNEEQIKLRLVLKEIISLMKRMKNLKLSSGILHDVACEIVNSRNRSIGNTNRIISCEEYTDAMLTIEGVSVICGINDEFVCGKIQYYPGVYRYPDGSGEPPSEDFIEEFTTKSPRNAAIYLIKTILEIELSQVAQSLDEDEVSKQEAKELF